MLRLTGFLQASCARRGREATTSGRGTGVPSSLLVLRSRGYCHGRAPVGDRGALDDAVAGLPRPPPLRGLGHPARLLYCEADDGSRTRDLRLGKPTLYQLSYVRVDEQDSAASAQRRDTLDPPHTRASAMRRRSGALPRGRLTDEETVDAPGRSAGSVHR